MGYLRTIENLTKKRMEPLAPPTDKEVLKGQLESVKQDIKDTLEHDKHLDRFDSAVKELLAEYSPEDIARIFLSESIKDAQTVPVKIAPERPLPSRKVSHSRSGHGRRGKYNHRGGDNHRRRRNDRRDNHGEKRDGKRREHDNKRNGRSKKSFKIRTNL
jgi:ATP-dependent RNA helicase DeaD